MNAADRILAEGKASVKLGDKLDSVNDSVTSYPYGHSYTFITSDTAVKSGAGVLHTLTFTCNDAAPTAGTIDVYDNTAGSGTKILSWTLTTAVFNPTTVVLDVAFSTGLYVDFTTTADVGVCVSYR